jgi:signal transduction histidine kinase
MQNRWFTYSFLVVLVGALLTLAILQYHWLGSVSDAERQRLEESVEASTENFISDFNESFSRLHRAFRIQVTNNDNSAEELELNVLESSDTWYASNQPYALTSEIYLIKNRENGSEINRYNSETNSLEQITPDSSLQSWLEDHVDSVKEERSTPLRSLPDLGDPSFLKIPVQVLDFVTLNRSDQSQNLEVRLSIDQLDDFVLIRLNDEVIQNELIPDIASRYFGDSYQDQYQISIVNTEDGSRYFTIGGAQEKPEFSKNLDRLNFSSLMMIENDRNPVDMEGDSVVFSFFSSHSERIITRERSSENVEGEQEQLNSNIDVDANSQLQSLNVESSTRDTSITTAFVGNLSPSDWQLWLSFKAGSLDEFVSKTRNRNLTISFGILLVLGISGCMILIFAQRSRELAEQQMIFVAGVSHELRTPITVIRSAAENLSEGVVQSEDRKKEYANLMLAESKRLSEMVDQIMEFSGIQSGKRIYSITDVAIDPLMQDVLREMESLAEQKNIEIQYANISKLPTFRADRDAIFLALTNLIRNAIKFSDAGSRVIFRVDEVTYKSELGLRMQIKDEGIGISEEEQKKIFQPFYRAEHVVSEQIKGNGIGLSLVERVAKAHDGTITVKSSPGVGSTFTLIIPVS